MFLNKCCGRRAKTNVNEWKGFDDAVTSEPPVWLMKQVRSRTFVARDQISIRSPEDPEHRGRHVIPDL